MQVAVIGAGAVGCYYGGLLLRAGHDVTFIGRQAHVDAINAHGLLLDTQSFKGHLPAKAATDATALASPDLVLFCVSRPIPRAVVLAGRLRQTSILSLQNGVDNPQRPLAHHPVIPRWSMSAANGRPATSGITAAEPRDRRLSRGETLAQTLDAAGIRTTIADDIETTLWSKLVINCAFNALSAVAGISYGPMLEVEGTRDVVASAVQEAVTVARASGVSMPDDLLERILKIPAAMPNQMSSTAQDVARGKPSEIDFLNGYVVRKGAELGIPTPTNHALQVMVKLAERRSEISGRRG
jgi:2-dehydropantoate 2-reductase